MSASSLSLWRGRGEAPYLSLNDIKHLDGGLDGSLRLVGIEAAGLEGLALVLPRNDDLNERVSATAGGGMETA